MSNREDQVIAHIGLYQLSFARVIEERFLGGEPCGRLMNQLSADDRIQVRRGIPDRAPKYYQLTRTELKRRGLPGHRAKRPKLQAFPRVVSILWFCNMLGTDRHLLELATIERLFPTGLPDGTHCIERGDSGHRIYRLRFADPAASGDNRCLLRSLRKRVAEAVTFPGLRPWVTSGRYAFAVLAEQEDQAQQIRQMISNDELLSSLAAVVVEKTPSLATLSDALAQC